MKAPRAPFYKRMWFFLLILGPGMVSAMAGNDAGGTATYSVIGANYGFKMLWLLVIVGIGLATIQEMCARMGVVTGKGLSDLIREEFGVRWTLFAMIILLVANIAVTIAEFAGIAASLEIFGITRYLTIPITAVFIWWLITKGTYRFVERFFIAVCFIYFSYIISGLMAKPDWALVLQNTVVPHFEFKANFIMIAIAMIGTTITPWMQFYLQSSIVERGYKTRQYGMERWDVILGAVVAVVIAYFIIVACGATLHTAGIQVHSAKDAALALSPLVGSSAAMLFALGLFGSSFLGATILPLSSAYAICEAFGLENGISKKLSEAPVFFFLFTALILIGAGVVLIPSVSLINVMVISQTANGILLPFILIFMLLLGNNKKLMGEHKNSAFYNIVIWGIALFLILLTIILLFSSLVHF
ncbi:MAG: Nramp family divalent metal transporter [Candidatus Margulisbacteria bacterium]|nr:Nramp family divalent metal transporter [Candidatus Margulisiibacteriota bacterium]MBU1021130.1 Nramp family divalent metal transporter [Candidatus Margulisiibacteriota bacterium]MBU1728685.1 Nramp family divalent metal transporter [Candidatus Margulisiibacteriota bacterium]MBU1955136.1 Nramp family divalent metal transporter [Candidatus Margulisiibacteriota bacterium]